MQNSEPDAISWVHIFNSVLPASNRIGVDVSQQPASSGVTFNAALIYSGRPEFGIPEFRIVERG